MVKTSSFCGVCVRVHWIVMWQLQFQKVEFQEKSNTMQRCRGWEKQTPLTSLQAFSHQVTQHYRLTTKSSGQHSAPAQEGLTSMTFNVLSWNSLKPGSPARSRKFYNSQGLLSAPMTISGAELPPRSGQLRTAWVIKSSWTLRVSSRREDTPLSTVFNSTDYRIFYIFQMYIYNFITRKQKYCITENKRISYSL